MSQDEKRFYRELKRDLKRRGNRKRRRYLKDVTAEPDDFEFGRHSSESLNGLDESKRRSSDESDVPQPIEETEE